MKKTRKKMIMRKVLSCFVVFVILMSAFSVAVLATESSNDTDISTAKTVSSLGYCSYVWIEITDKYCKGYEVYVDGVYQFTEGESGTPDGCCGFKVTPGYHTFKLTLNGKEVSKGWNCQCGVAYNWMSMNDMIPHWCEGGGGGNCDNPPTVNFDKSTYYEGDTVHITVSTSHSSVYYKIKDCSGTVRKNGYVSNGESIYYTIPSGASECCYWTICFYWDVYTPPWMALAGAGGEVTAQSYECSKCYSFYVCPHETPCKVWIEVEDKYCKGYEVYVDGVYQFTEGESGTLDGYCRFWVTPGTHKFELQKDGCSVSKSWYCYCGTYYSWVSMNDMDPHWCECNKPQEVKFRGTVMDIRGTTPWVQADKVISGSEYISVGDYTDIACYTTAGETGPCGHCDIVKKGDKVEVYGKRLPIYQFPMVISICGKTSYYMRIIGKPDLVIEDISWSPEKPKQGDTVTINIITKNQGSGNADEFYVCYYIGGSYYDRDYVSSLSAGSTTSTSLTWTADCGNHAIKAVADCYNAVAESNEENNWMSKGGLNIPCKPDLIIEDIYWQPENPKQGDTMTFYVYIKNQGSGSAGTSTVKYYIDGSYVASDSVPAFSAGSAESTQTFTWTANKCGNVQVKAAADATNAVDESNEGNNERTETVSVICFFYIRPACQDVNGNHLNDVRYEFVDYPSYKGTCDYNEYLLAPGHGTYNVKFTKGDLEATVTLESHSKTFAGTVVTLRKKEGSIYATSTPSGANVYLDGTYKGTSPITIPNVPVGTHTVKYTKTAYKVCEKTVTVYANQQRNVHCDLEAKAFYIRPACQDVNGNHLDGVSYEFVDYPTYKGTCDYNEYLIAPGHGTYKVKFTKGDLEATVTLESHLKTFAGTVVTLREKEKKSDLTIQDISWTPQNPKLGDEVKFAVIVKNIGKGTSGKSHVYIYTINWDAGKILFKINDACPSLKPGETYTYHKNVKIEDCGEYDLSAWADARKEVNETNEKNNYKYASFEIPCEKPELEKIWITGPDEIKAGETLQWQAYGSYSDETQKELTRQVSWTVDASDILQNKNIGKFNGLKGGEATLKIDYEGKSASKKVTVIEKENQPPKASFTYEKDGLTVHFTSTSSDPDGDIEIYNWFIGDGGTSNQKNPIHTYSSEGTYTVVLLVRDDKGAVDAYNEDVTVTEPKLPVVIWVDNVNNAPLPACGGEITVKAYRELGNIFDDGFGNKHVAEEREAYKGGDVLSVLTLEVPKDAKFIRVWQKPKIEDGNEEYWGSAEISPPGGVSFTRHTPWLYDIDFDLHSPYTQYINMDVNNEKHIDTTVRNPENTEKKVKVRLILDRDMKLDKDMKYDFDDIGPDDGFEVPSDETDWITFRYTPREEGIWKFRAVVRTLYDDGYWVVTDQHDWYLIVSEKEIMRARSLQFVADYYIGIIGQNSEEEFNRRMRNALANYTTEIGKITSKALARAYDPTAGKLIGIILDGGGTPCEEGINALCDFAGAGLEAWNYRFVLDKAEHCRVADKLKEVKSLAGEEVNCWKERDIKEINKKLEKESMGLAYVKGFTHEFSHSGSIKLAEVPGLGWDAEKIRKKMDKIEQDMRDERVHVAETYYYLNEGEVESYPYHDFLDRSSGCWEEGSNCAQRAW